MILVTGAAGFVGTNVCRALRQAGVEHVGLDYRAGGDWVVCDIADRAAVDEVFRKYRINAVIHLAAILPTASRANPELATRVNVLGGTNLIDAAAQAGVERFVFGSSMSVYGLEGVGLPHSEEYPARPTGLYGTAKRYVEIYGELVLDGRFVALRMATVIGPGVGDTASPWRAEIFERVGSDDHRPIAIPFPADALLSMVHVDDVSQMLSLLATRESIPARIYHTPAENCRARDLKRIVEAADERLRVDLDTDVRKQGPPAADGSRFRADFGYKLRSLAERYSDICDSSS